MDGALTECGKKYFMTSINDSTEYYYAYLLKPKDEVLQHFKVCRAKGENQLERKITRVQSNRGVQISSFFFCAEHSIIH